MFFSCLFMVTAFMVHAGIVDIGGCVYVHVDVDVDVENWGSVEKQTAFLLTIAQM